MYNGSTTNTLLATSVQVHYLFVNAGPQTQASLFGHIKLCASCKYIEWSIHRTHLLQSLPPHHLMLTPHQPGGRKLHDGGLCTAYAGWWGSLSRWGLPPSPPAPRYEMRVI